MSPLWTLHKLTFKHDVVQLAPLCVLCLPELVYDDVFTIWETIWAAKYVSSSHFVLFIALALVEMYRDIILENNMDFTDIIKFFNGKTLQHITADGWLYRALLCFTFKTF